MTTAVSEVLDRIAPLACVDVFASYRVALRPLPRPKGASMDIPVPLDKDAAIVAAVVGFTGPELRGAVLLASSFDVVARARPEALADKPLSKDSFSDWVMVRDWAGELANQILGRIKNRLRAFNVIIEVSPPTALSGRALTFAKPKSRTARPFLFDAHGDRVWLWLDAAFDPALGISAGGEESAKEGDIILF